MNIQKCLLNTDNDLPIIKGMISDQLKSQGKSQIWEDRGSDVDTIVIHYMSAIEVNELAPFDINECLQIFVDFDVSSHYLIDRSGSVFSLVPEDKKAWHCGGSIMPDPDNREGVNDFSIGIELMATKDSGFTYEQYEALKTLCKDLENRYDIKSYVGHEDIAGKRAVDLGIRNEEKVDPGAHFDWSQIKGNILS